eukprot:CAMPEP_0117658010 /NCGR_PEP_ID=MMETSP0804-20121206/5634_1 /TAXON_ID=1074897 /ORGANISM="Tetraselmis astigmatica, Strain CCMP880" /LENGTH=94 /DNA_ID=CAMNT_0005464499 /DNA_START=104 /DNA_END=388 /DNA_ORIENTATION=-
MTQTKMALAAPTPPGDGQPHPACETSPSCRSTRHRLPSSLPPGATMPEGISAGCFRFSGVGMRHALAEDCGNLLPGRGKWRRRSGVGEKADREG